MFSIRLCSYSKSTCCIVHNAGNNESGCDREGGCDCGEERGWVPGVTVGKRWGGCDWGREVVGVTACGQERG